ncbi:MAG: TonB-dependent receptor [Sphingomonas sp.]|nr:TonB-dependent receptor [Sphingomonas sp.]
MLHIGFGAQFDGAGPAARRRVMLAVLLTSGCILASTTLHAQTMPAESVPAADASPAATHLQDIVVTANRRNENIQKVPIAISAFNGAALTSAGITNASDLGAVVPGLVYSSVVGYANPYLRGIGSTATGPGRENPIATYIDGVYIAAQSSAMLSLNNIAGVEVDKGPQGTLFGRNATGGAIQINTLTPSSVTSVRASVGYGNYDTFDGKLYATTGVAANLAADIAIAYTDQGKGYATNLANGRDVDKSSDFVVRSKLHWIVGDATTVTLAGDYGRTTGIPTLAPAPGTVPQFNPPVAAHKRDVYGDPQPFLRGSQWGVAATVKHEFQAVTLTSITAYRDTRYDSLFDSTLTAEPGTIFFITGKEPHKQFSQEFQLASGNGGPLTWVVGAYYFYERSGFMEPTTIGGDSFALFGLPSGILQLPDRKTNAAAAFGQGTYAIDPATRLTLGLRYTYERRTNRFIETLPDFGINDIDAAGHKSFNNASWRLALSHDFRPGVMGYASYNRGFKSGLYNSTRTVEPERLDAFEVGLKSALFERRVRLNLAGFYYLYKNIQSTSYPDGNLVITNGAKATLYGIDADAEFAVTKDLRITGGLEALHSRYDSFPDAPISVPLAGGGTTYVPGTADGNALARSPKLTANIAADYVHIFDRVKVAANVTYSYNDGWFAEADNRLRQPAYSLLNAALTFGPPSDGVSVKLWARNLLGEDYAVALAAQTNGDFVQWAPPRTFGVTLLTKF